MMADFILLGASGHSKVIIDMLHRMSDRECEECKIALLDDDEALLGTEIMGHSVIGKLKIVCCIRNAGLLYQSEIMI